MMLSAIDVDRVFLQCSPCFINKEGDGTVYNEHSWNNNASIIFLDQVGIQ